MVRTFEDVLKIAKSGEKKVLAVAAANDKGVLEAVKEATNEGLVKPILLGPSDEIRNLADEIEFNLSDIEVINADTDIEAAREATKLVSSKKADILMKGLVGSADILRQVLDKDIGLRSGKPLSQIAIFQMERYPKMFMVTDPAMTIAPDLKAKKGIIDNAVELAHALGIEKPKVAVLAAMEKVSDSMQATVDAKELTKMCKDGEIKGCTVYGPLALDNAVSKYSAKVKNIDSEVAGDADILLVPNIDAGNMLYKSLTFLGGADSAGIIMGASAPMILTSRADEHKAKFNSIALATILANKK